MAFTPITPSVSRCACLCLVVPVRASLFSCVSWYLVPGEGDTAFARGIAPSFPPGRGLRYTVWQPANCEGLYQHNQALPNTISTIKRAIKHNQAPLSTIRHNQALKQLQL